LTGVTRSETAEVAEARDADGTATDRKAYSVTKKAEITGLIDGTFSVTAGSVVTAGGITSGIVTDLSVTETNDGYQTFSATVETKDSATNVAVTS
jgi:hypothetical protein